MAPAVIRATITLAALSILLALPAVRAEASVTGDWGRYAAVASRFNVPLPTAYVHSGECPDVPGVACAYTQTGEAWVPTDSDRFTLGHELGHLFDAQYLADADREWLRHLMRGAPGGEWWGPEGAHEWFADYYATCAIKSRRREFFTGYIDYPTPNLQRVCNAIGIWGLLRIG